MDKQAWANQIRFNENVQTTLVILIAQLLIQGAPQELVEMAKGCLEENKEIISSYGQTENQRDVPSEASG